MKILKVTFLDHAIYTREEITCVVVGTPVYQDAKTLKLRWWTCMGKDMAHNDEIAVVLKNTIISIEEAVEWRLVKLPKRGKLKL